MTMGLGNAGARRDGRGRCQRNNGATKRLHGYGASNNYTRSACTAAVGRSPPGDDADHDKNGRNTGIRSSVFESQDLPPRRGAVGADRPPAERTQRRREPAKASEHKHFLAV